MPVWCWGCSLDGTNQIPPKVLLLPPPKPGEDVAKGRVRSCFRPVQCSQFLHSLLSFLSLAEHQVWALSICLEINTVVSPKPSGSGNWRVLEK